MSSFLNTICDPSQPLHLLHLQHSLDTRRTSPLSNRSIPRSTPSGGEVHIALACTGERTADRPSMGQIVNELQAIGEEVAGKEVLCATAKVDAQVQEMKDVVAGVLSLDSEIKMIGERS
ncbi:unnamed protein product [Closterium sp. Naga37s-1]|nr:unnamed protein product [Closterium sp. Naga37s-1]